MNPCNHTRINLSSFSSDDVKYWKDSSFPAILEKPNWKLISNVFEKVLNFNENNPILDTLGEKSKYMNDT